MMAVSPQPRDIGSRLARIETQLHTLTGRVPSLPSLAIPLYRLWAPALQTATATAFATVPASSAVGMGDLWQGRIDVGSHPCLSIDGVWGDLDSTTPTVTYQINVGLLTATWQSSAAVTEKHLVDIRPLLGESNLQIRLSIQSTGGAAGSDRLYCQPLGVFLRGMPDDGVFG